VVNGGADLIGAGLMPLVVTSIVPTAAGQLVFARTRAAASEDATSFDAPVDEAAASQT
jgi:hypothetical protein